MYIRLSVDLFYLICILVETVRSFSLVGLQVSLWALHLEDIWFTSFCFILCQDFTTHEDTYQGSLSGLVYWGYIKTSN